MEALLLTKPSLCFNKKDFMMRDFTVEEFVNNYRKYASLETIFEDLELYSKFLCSAMVELINEDYADFLNLSSNLVGLDKSIKNFRSPLEKLKLEVEGMKLDLSGTLSTAESKFMDYIKGHKKKAVTRHIQSLFEGLQKTEQFPLLKDGVMIPPENLERMALQFNLLLFLINKINLKELENKTVVVENMSTNLKQHLKHLFLKSLSEKDVDGLCKILRIYAVINNEKDIEAYFSQTIVRPYMRKHITEEYVLKLGLTMVYNKVLDFIPTNCTEILNATREGICKRSTEFFTGYDFLVNSVWPEIVYHFELISPIHVYAPGDANQFQINFTAIQTSVQRLRKHGSYSRFMNIWNIDLYYQIRFQEIGGAFESSLLQASKELAFNIPKCLEKDNYVLNSSRSVLQCIRLCWDGRILIQPLCHKFFGLTLLLISRYSKWTQMSLMNAENKSYFLSPIDLAVIMRDVEHLILELNLLYEQKILAQVSRALVEAAFQESIKSLENIIPFGQSVLIKVLHKQCSCHLKLIMDIPRLYRKTNRNIPSKASPYVSEVFDLLAKFLSETQFILTDESRKLCLKEVIHGIIAECFTIVQNVLVSIKKMEDSLKILKRTREKPLREASSRIISDDDKIRHQIAIDINIIEEMIRNLGLEVDNVKCFKDLKHLINLENRNYHQC